MKKEEIIAACKRIMELTQPFLADDLLRNWRGNESQVKENPAFYAKCLLWTAAYWYCEWIIDVYETSADDLEPDEPSRIEAFLHYENLINTIEKLSEQNQIQCMASCVLTWNNLAFISHKTPRSIERMESLHWSIGDLIGTASNLLNKLFHPVQPTQAINRFIEKKLSLLSQSVETINDIDREKDLHPDEYKRLRLLSARKPLWVMADNPKDFVDQFIRVYPNISAEVVSGDELLKNGIPKRITIQANLTQEERALNELERSSITYKQAFLFNASCRAGSGVLFICGIDSIEDKDVDTVLRLILNGKKEDLTIGAAWIIVIVTRKNALNYHWFMQEVYNEPTWSLLECTASITSLPEEVKQEYAIDYSHPVDKMIASD